LHIQNNHATIAESSEVTADIFKALEHCPTRNYVVLEQPGVSSADYVDGRAAPQLSQYMAGKHDQVKTTLAVPEIVGQVDWTAVTEYLSSKCGGEAGFHFNKLAALPSSKTAREQQLQHEGTEPVPRNIMIDR
jgi:hypothetical protein